MSSLPFEPGATFNSQYGEDEWIAGHLDLPLHGVFVDVGCGHPVHHSNTAFVRTRGWTGIAIDANEAYRPQWESLAPETPFVQAVISAAGPLRRFAIHENALTSRLDPEGELMTARTLEDVLQHAGIQKIDLLSVDIEGAEFEALTTMDLAKHAPSIIIAEYRTSGPEGATEDLRVLHRLLDNGYDYVRETFANHIFTRRDGR